MRNSFLIIVILILLTLFLWVQSRPDNSDVVEEQTPLQELETGVSKGETDTAPVIAVGEVTEIDDLADDSVLADTDATKTTDAQISTSVSTREISQTDGVKHSIPLGEVLSGGVRKDGIPAINEPKFTNVSDANKRYDDEAIGIGLSFNGHNRFYPYEILVLHEIVNDDLGGAPAVVTYCPLCGTGVVFDPRVGDTTYDFGVSGMLWQSNLLMYNRTGDANTETLWSQVLGEAVVGPLTGTKLEIIPADTVTFGEWKAAHPDTKVLDRDSSRAGQYGRDPYGNYYTSEQVYFPVSNQSSELHPKAYVLGIELDGQYKAYLEERLAIGQTEDIFAGQTITINKSATGEVRMKAGDQDLPFIGAFWFSWVAVHPETELRN